MPASNAISAFGTRFLAGDGGGVEVFTDIAEIRDIDGPGVMTDTTETTQHLSPDATKEYLPTLKDLDDISFELGFVPTDPTHDLTTGMLKDWFDRTRRNYRIIFPDGTTWGLTGFVTGFKIQAQLANSLIANATIKLTGGITEIP